MLNRLLIAAAFLIAAASLTEDNPRRRNAAQKRKKSPMADRKSIFVAFAIEDETQRNFLKGQALNAKSPFDYVDMSVKEAYVSEWKDKVRTRIRRSDGVIVLISKNSLTSSGQKWEIQCAQEERKPILGVWAYGNDRTTLSGVRTVEWRWDAIRDFIDGL